MASWEIVSYCSGAKSESNQISHHDRDKCQNRSRVSGPYGVDTIKNRGPTRLDPVLVAAQQSPPKTRCKTKATLKHSVYSSNIQNEYSKQRSH